jgi:hypothetical protein
MAASVRSRHPLPSEATMGDMAAFDIDDISVVKRGCHESGSGIHCFFIPLDMQHSDKWLRSRE